MDDDQRRDHLLPAELEEVSVAAGFSLPLPLPQISQLVALTKSRRYLAAGHIVGATRMAAISPQACPFGQSLSHWCRCRAVMRPPSSALSPPSWRPRLCMGANGQSSQRRLRASVAQDSSKAELPARLDTKQDPWARNHRPGPCVRTSYISTIHHRSRILVVVSSSWRFDSHLFTLASARLSHAPPPRQLHSARPTNEAPGSVCHDVPPKARCRSPERRSQRGIFHGNDQPAIGLGPALFVGPT